MSYTIEYDRKVFKIPAGTIVPAGFGKVEHKLHEEEYYLFTKSGCNNIDPRPQNWQLTEHGWNYKIINTVCERAGWTEGGELKMVSGNTTPEAYLRMHRKEIQQAEKFTLERLQARTGIYGGYLWLSNKHNRSAEWVSKTIAEVSEWFTPRGEYLHYFRYEIQFKSLEHFRAFLAYKWIAKELGGFATVNSYSNK